MQIKLSDLSTEINKCAPVIKLVNKYFWKTKIGPIFSLLFPLLLMIVYFAIAKSKNSDYYLYSGLPSSLSLSILPLILLTLPTMIIEFRNSIILRKVKIMGISRFTYMLLIYFLFFLYSWGFGIVSFFLFSCFISFNDSIFSQINWGSMIYGTFCLIISGIAFGLVLSIISKTSLSSQLIGFGVLLLTLIFSGQFMPLSVIGTIEPIKYISLLSPLSYSANIYNVALYSPITALEDSMPDAIQNILLANLKAPSNNIFNFHCAFWLFEIDYNHDLLTSLNNINPPITSILKVTQVNIYDIWQKVLFVIMPFILSIIFILIFLKRFRWTSR